MPGGYFAAQNLTVLTVLLARKPFGIVIRILPVAFGKTFPKLIYALYHMDQQKCPGVNPKNIKNYKPSRGFIPQKFQTLWKKC